MIFTKQLYQPFIFFLVLICIGCGSKKEQTLEEASTLDLLRGEITLCGNPEFGKVSFTMSCNEGTRETFDLAISLLHSFEYDEAEKAFVQVMDADPTCAMAYWGVAMSNFHSLWLQGGTDYLEKGSKVLNIARGLEMTERETDYIDAIFVFYNNWETIEHKTRITLFEEKMKALYVKYRNDKEAAIFYALALRATADPSDKTYTNQLASGKILESLFPDNPNHPGIAHYIIHNYDYPELAELALPTARRYAQIAPSSSHAQHMPSHIFTRLGLWDESINSNINSTSAAFCYSESINPNAHWDEELHGMDYLVYAYLQIGENEKALAQYEYLKTFKEVFPVNFKIGYAAASIPSRIALENRDWNMAANLQLPTLQIDWNEFPWQKSIFHFTRAFGSIQLGNLVDATNELERIRSLHLELVKMKDAYKANQVEIQINIIEAWILYGNGRLYEAITKMKHALDMENNTSKHAVTPGEVLPAGELLGDLLLACNKPDAALEAYKADLERHPNRFNGFYGAAKSARQMNNKNEAVLYYKALIDLAPNSPRVEVKEAKEYLQDTI